MTAKCGFAVYRSLGEIPADFGPSVVSVGNFDGVHRGHRAILASVAEEAGALGARAVALTFEPHPEQFLRPLDAPKLITPVGEKLRLLAATGIDAAIVLPFDAALAATSARAFVEQVLVGKLRARAVHEGANFRFGVRAEAGVDELAKFGLEMGFSLQVHPAVSVRGIVVSSTAVRALIAAGDVKCARWLLGRPFSILSTQQRDRGVGASQLVPTVNLAPYAGLLPAFGVYVARLAVADHCFDGVTNVGNRPTFEGAGFSVETHILNFHPIEMDTGAPLELTFLHRLRGEQKWPSADALKTQIMKDVTRAKRYLRRTEPLASL
jgi:riboflavin kinase / FMN adenylyltransferase